MKNKNTTKQIKPIWKDKIIGIIFIFIFFLLVPLLIISILITLQINLFIGIITLLISIAYFLYIVIRVTKSRITLYLEGISMGSLKFLKQGITKFPYATLNGHSA